jgi:ssDNA-binding replication factor A large subunit
MTDKTLIQGYINNFRRRIGQFLRPGIGLACTVYPAEKGGAILEFTLGRELENDDVYRQTTASVANALAQIKQRAFGGNLSGFVFGGTNVIMEDNRIIFIKDDSSSEWTDDAAQNDVKRILPGSHKAGR